MNNKILVKLRKAGACIAAVIGVYDIIFGAAILEEHTYGIWIMALGGIVCTAAGVYAYICGQAEREEEEHEHQSEN